MNITINKPYISSIRHLLLCAYVFSLPFDTWDGFRLVDSLATSNMLGLSYIVLCMVNLGSLFRVNKNNKALFALIMLGAWLFATNFVAMLLYSFDFNILYFATYAQALVMFWLISNEIYRDDRVRRYIYISFLLSVLTIFVLINFGYGIQVSSTDSAISLDEVQRLWFFGMNPNNLGNLAALGLIIAVGLFFEMRGKFRYLLILLPPVFLSLISISGSAGAVLALLAGIVTYFYFKSGRFHIKLGYYILGVSCIMVSLYYIASSEYLADKLSFFVDTGSTSGRTLIWENSLQAFTSSPLFGFGFSGGEAELGALTGGHTTSHNVFLDILLWGGVPALLLYSYFYYVLLRQSLKFNKIYSSPLHLAIFIVCLFLALKSGGGFFIKYIWILLACIAVGDRAGCKEGKNESRY